MCLFALQCLQYYSNACVVYISNPILTGVLLIMTSLGSVSWVRLAQADATFYFFIGMTQKSFPQFNWVIDSLLVLYSYFYFMA